MEKTFRQASQYTTEDGIGRAHSEACRVDMRIDQDVSSRQLQPPFQ